jgi:hypothetical protein
MRKLSQPPKLADLFARYLDRQAAAQIVGLGFGPSSGDVVPHEAVPAQPIDPRLAWDEALTAVHYYSPTVKVPGEQPPADWSSLVSTAEPLVALPFCVGNFPQLVRSLQPLLHMEGWPSLQGATWRALPAPGLIEWACEVAHKDSVPQRLLAAGTLRLARQFDHAAKLLERPGADLSAQWQAAWANEKASLAWHRGHWEEAAKAWGSQPQSIPVQFNRGMSALFLGRPSDARASLAQAASLIPETDGWHHLARLYLAVAES